MNLNRLFERLRGDDDTLVAESRKAVERTEEIGRRVDRQWAEVLRHNDFTIATIQDNSLAEKLHRAIGEVR